MEPNASLFFSLENQLKKGAQYPIIFQTAPFVTTVCILLLHLLIFVAKHFDNNKSEAR